MTSLTVCGVVSVRLWTAFAWKSEGCGAYVHFQMAFYFSQCQQ